jgi:hypothetical protein
MKFEDIKGVIRTRKSMKDRQSYCQKKKDKVAMIYKPLHRKVNIEEHMIVTFITIFSIA